MEIVRRGLTLSDGVSKPIWAPYPDGPQERALNSMATIVGYGGAAGGGKTDLILGAACTRHRSSLILRREYPQLEGIVERSRELFEGKGKWVGAPSYKWTLNDGRRIKMGAVAHEKDKLKYRGRPHDLKAYDEATEIPESVFWFTMGWLRTTVPGQHCRAILTFNPPTSAEGMWVVRLFAPWLDRKHARPAAPGELRYIARVSGKLVERDNGEPFEHKGETVTPISITFFPARLADNPALLASGYATNLNALPEPLRSQLLYGDFDAGVEDDPWQIVPTAWVEAAMERWADRRPTVSMTVLGMDVARGGKDQSVFAPRHGNYVAELKKHPGKETPDGDSAAALAVQYVAPGARVNVDVIGWGSSSYDRMSKPKPLGYGLDVYPINFANKSSHTDKTGKYGMVNVRAEAWWRLRESLDPRHGDDMALPPDSELLADLTAGKYEITPRGIKVEPKDEIAGRLGRSPDCGDAVALTMLDDSAPNIDAADSDPFDIDY